MRVTEPRIDFPAGNTVVYCGHVFQTELNGIPKGGTAAVPGGAAAEMREIFRQLDAILSDLGCEKTDIVEVKLYLQDLKRDSAGVNQVYTEYFGSHTPSHGVYGVELQPGILVEAGFTAHVPVYE